MKRFLRLHFNMIDDLRRASDNAEKAGYGVSAGNLLWYADELERYKPEPRYLCDIGHQANYAMKVWQKNTLNVARQYDHCIFTQPEIIHLAERLNEYAHQQRNCTEAVTAHDFDDEKKYHLNPAIRIGSSCQISFIPIKGDYEY